MTSTTTTTRRLALAVLALSLGLGAARASAAEAVRYRADLRIDGTWSESVRAGADEADGDGDGREEVAARDQELGFTVTSSVAGVTFRDGRLAARATGVQHAFPVLQVASSTLVEPNGEPGSCHVHEPGTGGAAELAAAGEGLVFRPAEDVIFQLVCTTEHLEWGFAMDAMRGGGALGEAPLDAGFAVPPSELGAQRIERAVAASDAQRSPQRCPLEDPGHTVACSFGWSGSVVLERTDRGGPEIRRRAAGAWRRPRRPSKWSAAAACAVRLSVGGRPQAGHGAGRDLARRDPALGRGPPRRPATRPGAPAGARRRPYPFLRPPRASGALTRRHR